MSALNIVIEHDRVLIGTDTTCSALQHGQRGSFSKVAGIPHAGLLVGGRGLTIAFAAVIGTLWQSTTLHDFDTALDHFPTVLQGVFQIMEAHAPSIARSEQAMELIVAGWSERSTSMRAQHVKINSWSDSVLLTDIAAPGQISPWESAWDPFLPEHPPRGADGMRDLLLVQMSKARETYGAEVAIGGELVLAELDLAGMRFTKHRLSA